MEVKKWILFTLFYFVFAMRLQAQDNKLNEPYLSLDNLQNLCAMDTSSTRKILEANYWRISRELSTKEFTYFYLPFKNQEIFIKYHFKNRLEYATLYKLFLSGFSNDFQKNRYKEIGNKNVNLPSTVSNENYYITLDTFTNSRGYYKNATIVKYNIDNPKLYLFSVKELEYLASCDSNNIFYDYVYTSGFKKDMTDIGNNSYDYFYIKDTSGVNEKIGLTVLNNYDGKKRTRYSEYLEFKFNRIDFFDIYESLLIAGSYKKITLSRKNNDSETYYSEFIKSGFRVTFSKTNLSSGVNCSYTIRVINENSFKVF